MSNDQKKALRKIVSSLGVVLLLIGALTEVYSTNTGLILALIVWLIGLPALNLFGLGAELETKAGEEPQTKEPARWKFSSATIVTLIVLVAVLVWLLATTNLNSGPKVTQSRPVTGFNQVEIDGSGRLIIEQTGRESLKVKAGKNMIDRIDTRVVGNTLYLRTKWSWFSVLGFPPVEYHLTVDQLERVNLNGSGDIIVEKLAADKLEVTMNGSGQGHLVLSVGELDARISGSGNFVIEGRAARQRGAISGSGNYNAKELTTKSTRMVISGSGHSIVNAKENLDVVISGSGQVEYLGSPRIDQEINGSGDISRYR